jgi:hypothetical protein
MPRPNKIKLLGSGTSRPSTNHKSAFGWGTPFALYAWRAENRIHELENVNPDTLHVRAMSDGAM